MACNTLSCRCRGQETMTMVLPPAAAASAAADPSPPHRWCCSRTRGGRRRPCGSYAILTKRHQQQQQLLSGGNGDGSGKSSRVEAHDVVHFYKYFEVADPPALKAQLLTACETYGLRGRVLISSEGINGALSAPAVDDSNAFSPASPAGAGAGAAGAVAAGGAGVDAFVAHMSSSVGGFESVDWKIATSKSGVAPFGQMPLTVKIVRQIVGQCPVDSTDLAKGHGGRHLSPQEWHAALEAAGRSSGGSDDLVLLDVRNSYEHSIGYFEKGDQTKAVEPIMAGFSEFDSWAQSAAPVLKGKKVLMYCTGGIRCEKASAMLKYHGVQDVNQLSGGIHKYLATYPKGSGLFRGKNYVFDHRVIENPDDVGEVVGRCVECAAPFDLLCGDRVCAVCNDLVLVCPHCALSLREYHCQQHQEVKAFFFRFIDGFTMEELAQQRDRLEAVVARAEASAAATRRRLGERKRRQWEEEQERKKSEQQQQLLQQKQEEPGAAAIAGEGERERRATHTTATAASGNGPVEMEEAKGPGGGQYLAKDKGVAPLGEGKKTAPESSRVQLDEEGKSPLGVGDAAASAATSAAGASSLRPAMQFNVVRACRKQCAKVAERLRDLAAGEATIHPVWSTFWQSRCRSCGQHAAECLVQRTQECDDASYFAGSVKAR